jgi:ABC-type transport system involved in multi-copper enzyme maturation permease subunit
MSSLPSTSAQSGPQRSVSLVMGSQNFVSVLLRCTAAELYKIRRRAMSKILLLIGVVMVVAAFSVIALPLLFVNQCTSSVRGGPSGCPSPEQLAEPLHLPLSLIGAVGVTDFIGIILIAILAGAVVGGEYGVGTIRVLLTRGPTRTQYLLAKILALLACIVITMVILVPVGIIVGALYNLSSGVTVDFAFLTSDWILHAVAYILLAILKLFIYTMLALWLATLGRSPAAGIAGGIVWWFLETILTPILLGIAFLNQGTVIGNILKAVPDYFVGNDIDALLGVQSDYLRSSIRAVSSSSGRFVDVIPDWRAWLVIAAYLVIFLGSTWLVLRRRDITN